ncbi:PAS domain S-box protein [Blastopirellula retiformator]|nr:PAS domain S-box protein [Blastopirellula retiformator]
MQTENIYRNTDRLFAVLMPFQWICGIIATACASPWAWSGQSSYTHPHVWLAMLGGGLCCLLPCYLAIFRPGRLSTRMVIGCSQMVFVSILIHVTGGRIETHFYVFGSLAFLAAYRDIRVLVPATLIVAADHFVRGIFWPESIFGIATASPWRWVEHTGWVLFEDVFLILSIRQSLAEVRELARQTTDTEIAMERLAIAKRFAEHNEARFRATFDHAAVGVAHIGFDGYCLRANKHICEMLEYTEQELQHLRFQDVTYPEDRQLDATRLQGFLDGTFEETAFEKRYVSRSGEAIWVRLTVSIVRDEEFFICVVEDIREERRAREALEKSHLENHKLSLVAAKARQSVIIADAFCRIEWVNSAFTQLTGFTQEEVEGRKPWDLLQGPETDPQTIALVGEKIRAKESVSVEIVNYSKTGEKYWIALEIEPVFDDQQRLTQFIATQNNVTERKRYEEDLRSAKDAAEAASAAKSEFLANMSHEIRTPLNGLLGFTDLLIRGAANDPAKRDEYLQIIRTSGRSLLDVINDLLDLSKIEAGKLETELLPCDPAAILSEVASILKVKADEKGLKLEHEWISDTPNQIVTDAVRLRQLLTNLIGNAIKFTEFGGVSVSASWSAKRQQLMFEVRDSGIGIPEDQLEAIFEPFSQADTTTTRRFGGTGLGLAICRRIADLLGGDVTVQSQVGAGTTFLVNIAAPAPDESSQAVAEKVTEAVGDPASARSGEQFQGVRALVAEDGPVNRLLVEKMLTPCGFQLTFVENGQLALEAYNPERFDLILMDMQMPVLDGYAATERLRATGCVAPIIAMTAHAMASDRQDCLSAGCSDYVSKPVTLEQLLTTIERNLPSSHAPTSTGDSSAETAAAPQDAPLASEILPGMEMLAPAIDLFVNGLPELLADMLAAAEDADWEKVELLAHRLRGSCGGCGFPVMYDVATALEESARTQKDAPSEKTNNEILATHEQLMKMLPRIEDSTGRRPYAANPGL